jgi:hypothetical protein
LVEYRECLEIDTDLAAHAPGSAQEIEGVAETRENIAKMLIKTGDLPGAVASEDQARQLREQVVAKDDKSVEDRGDLAANYHQLGIISDLLAKKTGDSQYVRQGCQWYGRELDVMRDLQQRGVLGSDDLEQLKTTAAKVSTCAPELKTVAPN